MDSVGTKRVQFVLQDNVQQPQQFSRSSRAPFRRGPCVLSMAFRQFSLLRIVLFSTRRPGAENSSTSETRGRKLATGPELPSRRCVPATKKKDTNIGGRMRLASSKLRRRPLQLLLHHPKKLCQPTLYPGLFLAAADFKTEIIATGKPTTRRPVPACSWSVAAAGPTKCCWVLFLSPYTGRMLVIGCYPF